MALYRAKQTAEIALKHTELKFGQPEGAKISELALAIETFLGKSPTLGKAALVQLLTKRFPALSPDQAWILVSRYFNR